MPNHNPIAGDYTFFTAFTPTTPIENNLYYMNNILSQTASHDADGDAVHLAFVNGQRIAPTTDPDHPKDTIVQGQYGALTIDAAGNFSYAYDLTNPAVQAMEANGGKLTDHFTFKVSDGRGGTDFGYFDMVGEAPQHGTSTITFDDTDSGFPYIYKGLQWGELTDDPPYVAGNSSNHFLVNILGNVEIPVWAGNGEPVTFDSIDLSTYSTPGTSYGADLTFVGLAADGSEQTMTTSIGPGSQNFDMSQADHVDLSSLGALTELRIIVDDFPGYDGNPYDNPTILLDNLTITV